MELDQLDVKTALLHGKLQQEILMSQPKGYKDPLRKDHVCEILVIQSKSG